MNTNENKRPLMKHFSAVLRRRALATSEVKEDINPLILKYFSRKDLIAIIKGKYGGTIPKEYDLVELENLDLLKIIEDDMYIISYMTKQWSKEQSLKIVPNDKTVLKEMDKAIEKSVEKKKSSISAKSNTKPNKKNDAK